jgi:predicted RNA-binding protein YlxR (DUF448 family)
VTCPSDSTDSEGECGTWLRVTGQDFGGHITCRTCNTSWPTERLLRVVATSNTAELWLDTDAAAEWLGVQTRTLRKWAAQGKIKRQHGQYEVKAFMTREVI